MWLVQSVNKRSRSEREWGGGGVGTDCAGTCKQDKELAFMLSEMGGL